MEWQVTVGNIGTVYDGSDQDEAIRTFHSYVKDSTSGYGRAAGEPVVLWHNGEPSAEHGGAARED